MVAKDPVDKLTHALCGLGRPFEIFNSKRKLFYYHLVTPQCRTHGVILLCAQRTTMPHSPPSDRCDQLIFRGNSGICKSAGRYWARDGWHQSSAGRNWSSDGRLRVSSLMPFRDQPAVFNPGSACSGCRSGAEARSSQECHGQLSPSPHLPNCQQYAEA